LELIKKTGFTRLFPNIKTRTQPIHRKDLVEVVSEIVELQDNIIMDIAGKKQVSIGGGLAKHLYAQEGYKCFLIPVPQFLIELGLVGLSFLPPPFQKENIKILRAEKYYRRKWRRTIYRFKRYILILFYELRKSDLDPDLL